MILWPVSIPVNILLWQYKDGLNLSKCSLTISDARCSCMLYYVFSKLTSQSWFWLFFFPFYVLLLFGYLLLCRIFLIWFILEATKKWRHLAKNICFEKHILVEFSYYNSDIWTMYTSETFGSVLVWCFQVFLSIMWTFGFSWFELVFFSCQITQIRDIIFWDAYDNLFTNSGKIHNTWSLKP